MSECFAVTLTFLNSVIVIDYCDKQNDVIYWQRVRLVTMELAVLIAASVTTEQLAIQQVESVFVHLVGSVKLVIKVGLHTL